jgi:hypothetical protein
MMGGKSANSRFFLSRSALSLFFPRAFALFLWLRASREKSAGAHL